LRIDDAAAQDPVVVDPFVLKATLSPSDFLEPFNFGVAVAISGDTIVIGAPNPAPESDMLAVAYVFVRPPSGWAGSLKESAKLVPSDSEDGDRFGHSVAISGDTVVVGAPWDNGFLIGGPSRVDQGSAYIFVKPAGGWTGTLSQSAKLLASDGAAGDALGADVAISGDTVVVGATADDGIKAIGQQLFPVINQGAAYVFVKPGAGWAGALTESAKLTASDRDDDDLFGASVGVSGDTVVVGTQFKDVGPNDNQGAAYVFVEPGAGWAGFLQENAKLTDPGGALGDAFGASVAISGDTVFVGAPGNDVLALVGQGSAYVFVEPVAGWAGQPAPTATLFASDGQAYDGFGLQVAASGDTVLISVGVTAGEKAYLFTKPSGGWVTTNNETQKLITGDSAYQFFGMSGNTIVAGHDAFNQAAVFVRSFLIENLASLLKKLFNLGSTIPVKFQLSDENGQPIPNAEAEALASACNVQISFSGGDRSPGCARYHGKHFQFNLKTEKSLPPGTYAITVKVFAGGELVDSETVEVQVKRSDEDENREDD
jgi:hypothetical protein